VIRCH